MNTLAKTTEPPCSGDNWLYELLEARGLLDAVCKAERATGCKLKYTGAELLQDEATGQMQLNICCELS